ncbi:hypothetical protein [Streptomyces silvensis]|uniref:Uncharacterized protein n=1 Tax=Streptomyces silvensis TaxID=1765722 RepID=A0A0W7XA26_9ACTN|nr:hypothetical protein [Streptomyces silvensis]KUF19616.1 hypothetical protein AT728_04415 [Streptomyces silvensis]
MSTAPAPEPRDPKDAEPKPRQKAEKPASALVFDDPLAQQPSDDTDRGWGERPTSSGDSAADLARFLDEKPPHHI